MVPFDQKSGGKGVSAGGQQGCAPGVSAEERCGAAGSTLPSCAEGTAGSKGTQMWVRWVRCVPG